MKERESWIDSLRGFAIVCMVVSHFILMCFDWGSFASFVSFCIYSFHMPLLFFISGSLVKTVKKEEVFYKTHCKLLDLLIPAVVFGGGCFCIYLPSYLSYSENTNRGGRPSLMQCWHLPIQIGFC